MGKCDGKGGKFFVILSLYFLIPNVNFANFLANIKLFFFFFKFQTSKESSRIFLLGVKIRFFCEKSLNDKNFELQLDKRNFKKSRYDKIYFKCLEHIVIKF